MLYSYKRIYDNANLEMWEADQLVKAHNPNAVLCGRKLIYSHTVMLTTKPQHLTDGVELKKHKNVNQDNIVDRKHKNNTYVLPFEFKA